MSLRREGERERERDAEGEGGRGWTVEDEGERERERGKWTEEMDGQPRQGNKGVDRQIRQRTLGMTQRISETNNTENE